MNYSEDQLLILTLLPYSNNIHIIDEKDIEHLKDSSYLYKNKDKLFNVIDNIDKNKLKECVFCSTKFSKITDLRKHILISCFHKKLKKDNTISNEKIICGDNNLLNCNNCNNTNITNNNNNNNITNIYLEIKTPIPFDEEWDISNINDKTRSGILVSKFMYTSLLEEILKNEINLNIIIDKDTESGIVYKNDIDKYINMKSKDIVSNTMDKLKKHLLDINKTDELCYKEYIEASRRMIGKKHIDYVKDPNINNGVNQCITNIFCSKKNEAINISKNIKQNNINLGKGF